MEYAGKKEVKKDPPAGEERKKKKDKDEDDMEDVKCVKKPISSKHSPEITKIVTDSILQASQQVKWEELVGLEKVKEKMKETITLPIKNPKLFTGILTPSKGILLYGPPGNGKTMVAKAIASECGEQITFFNLSAGSITSRYYGDSEKIVQAIFDIATSMQPSVIFIDEIDSILGARSSEEHEASKRLKTEFLIKLDGVGTDLNDRVVLVGATNRPYDLDEAVLRRFSARIFLPLPSVEARMKMIKDQTKTVKCSMKGEEFEEIAGKTEGYSFADLKAVCQEAAMAALRKLGYDSLTTLEKDQAPPLQKIDFEEALKKVAPSVTKKSIEAFEKWHQDNSSKI